MEKREFLKGAAKLAALAPIGAAAASVDNRLFGAPASVAPIDPALQNKMRLAFSRSSVPVEVWDKMAGLATGISVLQTSADARKRFGQSPRKYFEALGVDTDANFGRSPEVAMAQLMMDDGARVAAEQGDYVSFMQRVKACNLPTMPDASLLTKEIAALLQRDSKLYEKVRQSIQSNGTDANGVTLDLVRAASAALVASPDESTSVSTDTIAVVQVFVVGHVSIAAEVVAVAAVAVAIVAFGACIGAECHDPYVGVVSKLDQRLLDGAATVTSAARRMGNTTFQLNVAKEMLAREVEAIIGATESVGLVAIDPVRRPRILADCIAAAERVYGLAA